MSYTVSNSGAAAATGAWYDTIYLTPAAGGTPVELTQLTNPVSLAVGHNYTQTVSVVLPVGISGQYTISVTTNSSQSLFEINNSNNTGTSGAFSVQLAPVADLVVTSVTAPSTVIAGQSLSVSWIVANHGTAGTTAAAWYDDVYLSQVSTGLDNSATLIGQVVDPGYLDVNESYQSSLTVALSTTFPQGTYFVYVKTNATNSQPEYNASNNVTHSAVGVQVQPITNPALFDVTSVVVSRRPMCWKVNPCWSPGP